MTPLTPEELCFFKEYGYLLKRGALDVQGCMAALDRMWESAPPGIRRDDPETWQPIAQDVSSDDPLLIHQGTRWQLRSVGTQEDILQFTYSAQVVMWAEQLLGRGSLRMPKVGGKPMGSWGPAWPGGPTDPALSEGIRGLYATLPSAEPPETLEDHLHTDGHPFHLGVVGLLQDSPANGGAFKIWPGSHKRFYPLFPMQYDQARIPYYEHLPTFKGLIHPPEYLEEVARVEADTQPVDCHGEAGDIVFWHHRLGHMAGHNTAEPRVIRQAVLYDFSKTALDTMRCDPPQQDMWRDWGDELRAADVSISREMREAQCLPAAMG